jgi:hypothetical protein
LTVRYEDLVQDSDQTLHRIGRFLDLDPMQLIRPAANPRLIETPSRTNARDNIQTGSVGRWRHYRDLLAPALPILADLLPMLGYGADDV